MSKEIRPYVELVGLYPTAHQLSAPPAGASYAVFQVAGLPEAGLHGFLRLAPALGVAMAETAFPLHRIEQLAQVAAAAAAVMADGRIDASDIARVISTMSR